MQGLLFDLQKAKGDAMTDTTDENMKAHYAKLRERAEQIVLKARGNRDAPGFDLCVDAEFKVLMRRAHD